MPRGSRLDLAIPEAAVWRRTSCDCCRIRKEKCVGEPPCTRCASRNVKCTFKAAPARRQSSRPQILPPQRSQPQRPIKPSPRPRKREVVLVACEHCRARRKKCSGDVPSCADCETRGLACVYKAHHERSRGRGHSESQSSHSSPSERIIAEAEPDVDDLEDDRTTQLGGDVDEAQPNPEEFSHSELVAQPSLISEEEDASSSSSNSSDYTDLGDSEEDEADLMESEGFSLPAYSAPPPATWASLPTSFHPSPHISSSRHRISIQGLLQHVPTESHMPISDVRSEKPIPSSPPPATLFPSERRYLRHPRIHTDSPVTDSDIVYSRSSSFYQEEEPPTYSSRSVWLPSPGDLNLPSVSSRKRKRNFEDGESGDSRRIPSTTFPFDPRHFLLT